MDSLRSLVIALGKIELRGLAPGSYHVTDYAEEKVYP
jgi:hypothetical protein